MGVTLARLPILRCDHPGSYRLSPSRAARVCASQPPAPFAAWAEARQEPMMGVIPAPELARARPRMLGALDQRPRPLTGRSGARRGWEGSGWRRRGGPGAYGGSTGLLRGLLTTSPSAGSSGLSRRSTAPLRSYPGLLVDGVVPVPTRTAAVEPRRPRPPVPPLSSGAGTRRASLPLAALLPDRPEGRGLPRLALWGRHRRQVTADPRRARHITGGGVAVLPPAGSTARASRRTSLTVRSTSPATPSAAIPSSWSSRRSAAPIWALATCTACSAAARSCSCSSTCAVASSTRRSRAARSWSNADRRSRAFASACCLLDTFDAIPVNSFASGSDPTGHRLRPAHHHRPPTQPRPRPPASRPSGS